MHTDIAEVEQKVLLNQFPHSAFPKWKEFEPVTFRSCDHVSGLQITAASHYQSAIDRPQTGVGSWLASVDQVHEDGGHLTL